MIDLVDLATNGDADSVYKTGHELIGNDRTIGGAVHLISALSRAKRHDLAQKLARALYESTRQTRHLNVYLTAVLKSGSTPEIASALIVVKEHETQLQDDYDVQLVTTWLKALYETDDRLEFLRVHNDVCRASDRTGNAFVVGQYMRYLVRAGSYDDAVALFQAVSQAVQSDEIVRKIVAGAYVELGRLREAEEAIADTRDDFLRRSVVAKIDEYKAKVGYRESTPNAVRETPAATPQAQSKGKPRVFIVHGHDVGTRTSLENVLHRIGAAPLTFDTLPKEGSPTVIEVLEKHVPNVDAIVTLLTPDDEGRKRGTLDLFTARGRENCLIEAGFAMISRRSRSILVALGGVNIPSDFHGIHSLEAEVWNGEVAFRIAQRLRDMGFAVDPSLAI